MSQTKVQLVSNIVGNVSGGASFTGIVTATSFVGDGTNLTNTGATLSAASGSQRLVVTSGTSGVMTSVGTDADLSWDSTTNTLSATNVSIAGTLTYEDVTNVDSIGLVTARSGVNVTGGSVIISSGGLTVSGVTTVAAGSTSAPSLSPTGDNNTGIFFPSADTIAFAEGGAEVARFDSSGRLLVGTSSGRSNFFNSSYSPQFQVETADNLTRAMSVVSSTAGVEGGIIILGNQRSGSVGGNTAVIASDELGQIAFQGSDGTEFVAGATISAAVDGTPGANDMPGRLVFSTTADGASSPTERARISSSGGFSVGTAANPGTGAIYATGDITAFYSSDIRLKKDIEPISEPIKKLMEISGVTYKWNEEYLKDKDVDGYFVRETEVGVIAQEVEKVLPEVVATRENGYKAVRYEKLVALVIEAVKDQQKQIDELKARLEEI